MQFNSNTQACLNIITSNIGDIQGAELPDKGVLFGCVISGESELISQRSRQPLSKGKLFVKELSRSLGFTKDIRCAYFVADGNLTYELLEINGISDGAIASVHNGYEEIFRICELSKEPCQGLSEIAFSLHRLIKCVADTLNEETKGRVNTASLIREYIDSHASGKLTLEEISSVFFISKTQIFRIFKSYFGISPMQYFLQQKIEISKKMLIQDNMRVSDIAEALGFSDAKHYSKTFRKYTGALPRDYRKEMRLDNVNKNRLENGKNELS